MLLQFYSNVDDPFVRNMSSHEKQGDALPFISTSFFVEKTHLNEMFPFPTKK